MFVIFGICIWYTYSRGSFIALAGTMAIAVVIYVLIERRIWPILLLGMAGAGVGYFILAKALDSFSTVREKATARDEIYEESLRLFLESPIFGKGFGGFADYSTLEFGTPHSDYLYFAISGGIVALLWLVVFQIYLLRRAWKSQFYPEFLMFIAFMASGLTFNNMVRGRLSIIYLIVTLAFLVTPRAVQRMKRVSEARQPQEA
jgi:O-antigen ligase